MSSGAAYSAVPRIKTFFDTGISVDDEQHGGVAHIAGTIEQHEDLTALQLAHIQKLRA